MKLILENWQKFVNEQEIESMIEEDLIHEDELDEGRNPFESAKSNLPNVFYPNYKAKGIEGIKSFIANIKAKKRPFYSKFEQLTSEQQKAYQAIADKQLQIAEADLKVATAKEQPQANKPEQQKKIAKAEDQVEKAQDNLDAQADQVAKAISGGESNEQDLAAFNHYLEALTTNWEKVKTEGDPEVIRTRMTKLINSNNPSIQKLLDAGGNKIETMLKNLKGEVSNADKEQAEQSPELQNIIKKYGDQIGATFNDRKGPGFNIIAKFLLFLTQKQVLNESIDQLISDNVIDGKLIQNFFGTLSGQERKTFAQSMKQEGIVNLIKQIMPEKTPPKDDTPGGQTENPAVVDPEPDDLVELKKTYLAFRDKFYCPIDKDANRRQRREARLRCSKEGIAISKNDQHDKIKDLMVALEDIIEKEEGEAGYDSSKEQLQEQSSRPIVALKADLTMFLKQARGAGNIIGKAQETAGTKAGKYHLKKAIERAKNVLELTGGLYDDLRRISKGLGQRTKQEPPKTNLSEAAQEVEKAYNLVLSNIEDVIGDIGDDLPQSEFLPRMKKSLEGLESILKYFPKGRLGGKGSSRPDEIYTKYKEALSQFGDNFSILKNLPDELSDKDAGSTSLNVAAQQIRAFANDLVEIFGLQMPTSFNKKVEQGPPVEVPGTPDTEEPKEDPEQVIQDLAVDLEAAAEAAIQKATEELPDGSPEEIAERAGEILAADKAAEEELRKQAETEAAAKEALEQAKQEELKKQEELAVQNAMKGDKEEGKSIPFSTEAEIIKFFNFTLFKDSTIRSRLESVEMDDKDFSNFKKVLVYSLSSRAKSMNENLRNMRLIMGAISTDPKKTLKTMFSKDKLLYKWFKTWISEETSKKKLLFLKIAEHLKEKNYNFNMSGLTIQRIQALNFSAAPTDIPPKEEDAIKKTVEKVKDRLKDQYSDQDELMANVEQDVISVIQNPKNSEIFNWSTDQPSSELSSMVGDFVLTPTQNDAEGTPEVAYPAINYELEEDAKEIFDALQASYGRYNKKDKDADFDNDLTAFMNFLGSIKATLTEGKFNMSRFKKDKTIKRVMDKTKNLSTKFYSKFQKLGVDDKKPLERIMKAILGKPGLMAKLLGLIGAKRKSQEPVQESLERVLRPLIKQQLRGK